MSPVFLRSRKPQVVKFQEVSDLATTRGRKKVQEAAGGMEAVSGSGLCYLLLLLVDVLSRGSSEWRSCLSGSSLLHRLSGLLQALLREMESQPGLPKPCSLLVFRSLTDFLERDL